MPLPCRRWWLFCEGLGGKDHLASRSPGVLTTPRLQMAAQRREGPSWPEIAGRRGIDGWPVKAGCVVLSGLPGRCPSGRAQPASGSAAGGPPALPLDIVMELKARLAGGLGQALLQLPVGQGRSWNRGACTPNTEVQTLGTAETYFATAVKAKSTLRPVLALVSMNGSPNSCKEPWAAWQGSPGPRPRGCSLLPTQPHSPWPAAPRPPSSPPAPGQSPPGTGVRVRAGPGLAPRPPSPLQGRWRRPPGLLTLFPSSRSTTSRWAYSWISVSQACGWRAEARLGHPVPLQDTRQRLTGGPQSWCHAGVTQHGSPKVGSWRVKVARALVQPEQPYLGHQEPIRAAPSHCQGPQNPDALCS